MLVTLGTNNAIGAGGSLTLPYACRSVQEVFIKIDDAGAEAYNHTVTIQLGQRTIANGCLAWGLIGMAGLQSYSYNSTTELYYRINLGSHQLLDNENLYVTINASSALDAVDVSAVVDAPTGGEMPVRYTEFSDNTFTAENVLTAISFASNRSSVDEDTYNVEIRNAVTSSSPSFISCNNWYTSTAQGGQSTATHGLLVSERIPLTTSFNYSSSASTDRILVASQMGSNQRAVRQGRQAQAIAKSQVGR